MDELQKRNRVRKSQPVSVRLPFDLADWLSTYAAESGMMKSEVIALAIERFRRAESAKLNEKKQTLLDTLKRADNGSSHQNP